jgi:N4-gp56 family major capsid protein
MALPVTNLTTSPGMAQLVAVSYKREGLDVLEKKTIFRSIAEKDMLERQNGRTVQWYRYRNFSPSTTPSSEGVSGSGLAVNTTIIQATVSQYTSFVTVSDVLYKTALDPVLTNASKRLGYRGALSVDTMTRNVIDAESTSTNQAPTGTFLRVADIRAARHNLQALDVEPFDDSEFRVILHPMVSYDLVNDPAANGLADIVKYTYPKDSPLVRYEDRGTVAIVAGAKVVESTNTYVNGSPAVYRTYVFGKGGVGTVELSGSGPADVRNPKTERFNINIYRNEPGKISPADPTGVCAGIASYNFLYAAVILDGPNSGTYRYRTIDTTSSIG